MVESTMMKLKDVPDVVETAIGWKPSVATVRDWIKQGHIAARKIGGRVWVDSASVTEHLNGKEAQ